MTQPMDIPPLPPSTSNLPADLPAMVGTIEAALDVKPGQQTTEFWIAVAVMLVNTGAAVGLLIGNKIGAGAAMTYLTAGNGGVAGLYALARTWLKGKVTVGNPPGPLTISR